MMWLVLSLIAALLLNVYGFQRPWSQRRALRARNGPTVRSSAAEEQGKQQGSPAIDLDENDPEYEKKMTALELLDVLTCTDDEDDPEYDVSKDIRRDKLLLNNDYHTLKVQLRKKGLRTGGDKEEMIARLLLYTIDPSIDYMEATGREPTLSYIDDSDIESGNVAIIPEGERNKQGYDFNTNAQAEEEEDENASIFTRHVANDIGRIDAEDVQVLRPRKIRTSGNNAVGSSDNAGNSPSSYGQGDQVMMDGLTRQEIVFKPIHISRDAAQARREDGKEESKGNNANEKAPLTPYIRGYLVGGRDVLRTWERNPSVVVLLPDVLTTQSSSNSKNKDNECSPSREERERMGGGWRSRGMRVLADEIAFNMQCIVIVPDLARGLEKVEVRHPTTHLDASEDSGDDTDGLGGSLEGTEDYATRKRLFDDIASTIAFASTEYESECISLAGVRSGAGLALEASCDLYNMACLSQIYAMDDFRDINEDDGHGSARSGHWNMGAGLWEQQARMAPQPPQSLKYYRALAASQDQREADFPYLDNYFAEEGGSLYEAGDDWVGGEWAEDEGNEEGEEMDFSEAQLELMAENMLAELANEEDDNEESEPEVVEGHASSYFEGQEGGGNSAMPPSEKVKITDADFQAALGKASGGQGTAEAAAADNSEALRERERLLALVEEEKAEIAALVRRADEKAATNALTRNTLSSSSMLSLSSIPSLLPRALFLVDPTLYDQERVQQELRLPSFFVYGCADGPEQSKLLGSGEGESVRSSDRADLLFSLKKRRHEIVDFCIRQYEGVGWRFLSEPVTAEDAVCGQEAVVIGSAWLDIYGRKLASASRQDQAGARDGVYEGNDGNDGDRDSGNKGLADMGYSEDSQVLAQTKFDTPFVRISANQLGGTTRIVDQIKQAEEEAHASGTVDEVAKAFKRPSPVATFLHDDDQLYRDQPKDGWEFQQSV